MFYFCMHDGSGDSGSSLVVVRPQLQLGGGGCGSSGAAALWRQLGGVSSSAAAVAAAAVAGVVHANVGQNVTPQNPSLGLILYHFYI
jgi:hypothetical protein